MRLPYRLAVALILAAPILLHAQKSQTKPDPTPEALVRAKYVVIGILSADGLVDWGDRLTTHPDDRKAREDVEAAFRKWGRYTVTMMPGQAELVVLVRRARRGSVYVQGGPPLRTSGGVTIGKTRERQSGPQPSGGATVGAEAAPDTDLFDVYRADGEGPGQRLWRGAQDGGLDGTSPKLFEKYREAVEKTAKRLGL